MQALTRTLLKWEGAKPGTRRPSRSPGPLVHEADLVTVAGGSAQRPRYRVVVPVPQGSLDDEAKQGVVAGGD